MKCFQQVQYLLGKAVSEYDGCACSGGTAGAYKVPNRELCVSQCRPTSIALGGAGDEQATPATWRWHWHVQHGTLQQSLQGHQPLLTVSWDPEYPSRCRQTALNAAPTAQTLPACVQ